MERNSFAKELGWVLLIKFILLFVVWWFSFRTTKLVSTENPILTVYSIESTQGVTE